MNRILLSATKVRSLARLRGNIMAEKTSVRFNHIEVESAPPMYEKGDSVMYGMNIFGLLFLTSLIYPIIYDYAHSDEDDSVIKISDKAKAELEARRKARQARIDAATKK